MRLIVLHVLCAVMFHFLLAPNLVSAQGTLYTIQQTGPQDLRTNIVILSEGYTASQQNQFLSDAASMFNYLVSTPPWQHYQSYLNGYSIFVASNQSGSDDPSASIYRDTYFNSSFDSYGTARMLTIPPNDLNSSYSQGEGKVYSILANLIPAYDVVLLLVNDVQYGGSGGALAVSSLNSASREIAVHELGHSFAGLGDEYDLAYPGYPDFEEPNTTRQTARSLIKWNAWILPSTPVTTPETSQYGSVVGLFEGAHYHTTGWYRPKLSCKMNQLNNPFCQVCSETHVLAHYNLVSPIDSTYPLAPNVAIPLTGTAILRVKTKAPASPVQLLWYDDGLLLGITSPQASIPGALLGLGTHTVKCVVTDTTSLVRNDPAKLLRDSVMWTVSVAGGGCVCDCHGDPGQCNDAVNILDVVSTIDVAFRGISAIPDPNPECPRATTDVSCDGVTNVIDVTKVINVAFRGADVWAEFCNPCP